MSGEIRLSSSRAFWLSIKPAVSENAISCASKGFCSLTGPNRYSLVNFSRSIFSVACENIVNTNGCIDASTFR